MKILVSVFYLVIISCELFAQDANLRKLGRNEMKEDLEFYKTLLNQLHPGQYLFTNKTTVDSSFNETANNLPDSLNIKEFFSLVCPLTQSIKDLHTNIYLPKMFKSITKILPFKLLCEDSRLYVTENHSEIKEINVGDEITSINGESIVDICKKLKKYINVYDSNISTDNVVEIKHSFALLFSEFILQPDAYNLTIRNQFGSTKQFECKALDKSEKDFSDLASFSKLIKEIYPNKTVEYKFIDSLNTAYLKINSFDIKLSYIRAVRKFFKKADEEKYPNLILDLRDNPGGNYVLGGGLLEYFIDEKFTLIDSAVYLKKGKLDLDKKLVLSYQNFYWGLKYDSLNNQFYRKELRYYPNKRHYNGNVIVLTNTYTMSTASMVASFLKGYNKATVIGEETANSYYHFSAGGFLRVRLPNSKIATQIPLALLTLNVPLEVNDINAGVIPEVESRNTVQDKIKNFDRPLNVAFDLIKQKAISSKRKETGK